MMTSIHELVAGQHRGELLRAAAKRQALVQQDHGPVPVKPAPVIALRMAADDEAHVVKRLAELDDAYALEGPVLLAVIDGEPVAATSLSDRRTVANPFVPTQEAVALLRARVAQLVGAAPSRRRWSLALRPRAA